MSHHSLPSSSMSPPSTGMTASMPPVGEHVAPLVTRDSISFNMRRLEPWVSWSIAIYTAWIAVFAFPQVPVLWCFVIYAGLIGQWCQVRPPRHQGGMFMRASTLVAGAYVLHTYMSPEIGGPTGIFFFWLSITTLYYAFMLRPAWGITLVVLALASFVGSWIEVGAPGTIMPMLAQAGFLGVFPVFVAMRFGLAMRRPDEAMELSRIDRASGLYNKAGLLEYGSEMLETYRREKKAVTMAVFDCDELRNLRALYGRKVSRQFTSDVVNRFVELAADRGMVARTGPTEFTVLLLGRGREKALQAISREFGDPCRIELASGQHRVVLRPRFLLETVGQEKSSLNDLHDELSADLMEFQAHARQSEPVEPQPEAAQKDTVISDGFLTTIMDQSESHNVPATLPVPLAA